MQSDVMKLLATPKAYKFNFIMSHLLFIRVGDFFDYFVIKKIGFIWFKSDFFLFESFFPHSNHLTPLEVNQSSSAQCLRVANSNYTIKTKQIYI